MPKTYFAGTANGRFYFRASTGRYAFKSLTFNADGGWIGFTSKPGQHAVREVSKATYDILLAGKQARVAEKLAEYRHQWEQDCMLAEAAGKPKPHFYGDGFGSAPENSWVDADETITARLAELRAKEAQA